MSKTSGLSISILLGGLSEPLGERLGDLALGEFLLLCLLCFGLCGELGIVLGLGQAIRHICTLVSRALVDLVITAGAGLAEIEEVESAGASGG